MDFPSASPAPTKTRALVIIDVQNEFMSPNGNFPVPEDCKQNLIKNLQTLVPQFRESGGHVIWVRAIYQNRTEEPLGMKENTKGTDEWLMNATHVYHVPCCEAGTFGAEIDPEAWALADPRDTLVTKEWYSAFKETTALLDVLRAKNVGDVYFSGLASGTCVLASILDAIKLGEFQVHAVPDCMGYRRYNTHEDAIQRLKDLHVDLTDSHQI